MVGYEDLSAQEIGAVKMLHEILCAEFGGAFPFSTVGLRELPSFALMRWDSFATLVRWAGWGRGRERGGVRGC